MGYTFLYVLNFLLVFNFVKSQISSCPDIYLRFSKDHSFCKPSNRSCNIEAFYLSKEEIAQVLKQHNTFRSIIATQSEKNLPTAANMLQMEWDNELAFVAQKRAEQCIFAHDTPDQRRVQNFGVGQNIAIQTITGQNIMPPKPDWSFAVTDWFSEIVHFRSDLVSKFEPSPSTETEYGHFTQVIWADTFRVGCGYVLHHHGNTYTRLYVCNYGPAGNVYETSVYKIGPPCSQCPKNTCPGETCFPDGSYPGLCRRLNDQAPFIPLKQPAIFYCNFQDKNIEDCLINEEGPTLNKTNIYTALGGNFLETVLSKGQKSTLTFSKTLKPHSNAFCVLIKYRKGPTKAGNQANNIATATFTIPSMSFHLDQTLPDYHNSNQFFLYKLALSWDQETQMKISFSVGANAKPQFFDIDSISAVDGSC